MQASQLLRGSLDLTTAKSTSDLVTVDQAGNTSTFEQSGNTVPLLLDNLVQPRSPSENPAMNCLQDMFKSSTSKRQ